jgi:hypothetical protein
VFAASMAVGQQYLPTLPVPPSVYATTCVDGQQLSLSVLVAVPACTPQQHVSATSF